MALFVARPSRASWAFFGLVALGICSARGVDRYERFVVRRDAPASELAQDLAVCMFGNDTTRLLDGPTAAAWQEAIGAWMRAVVSVRQTPTWPARCVPAAERLSSKLQGMPSVPEVVRNSARTVLHSIQDASRDPFARVELADSDQLPRQLAELFDKVRTLSQGSREGWRAVPPNAGRYGTLVTVRLPRMQTLSGALSRPTLVSGDALTVFSTQDGATHVYQLNHGAPRDVTLGSGVTVGAARNGVQRVETDQGVAWGLLDASPRVLSMPAGFAIVGDPGRFAWDASLHRDALALVTLDGSAARLHVTPAVGAVAWQPPVLIGHEESVSAAVVTPSPEGWVVTTLRPRVSDSEVVQYTVRPGVSGALVASEGRRVGANVPSFGARVLTCASGVARYIVLVADQQITAMRVLGGDVRTAQTAALWPRGRDISLTCDEARALVSAVPAMPRGGHFVFSFDARAGDLVTPIDPPAVGPGAHVRGVALVRGGVISVVSNIGALRAFRMAGHGGARGAAQWTPAGLIALAAPSARWSRSFSRVDVASTGDEVAMFVAGELRRVPPRPPEGQDQPAQAPVEAPPTPYFSVVGSHDGGATFWSL